MAKELETPKVFQRGREEWNLFAINLSNAEERLRLGIKQEQRLPLWSRLTKPGKDHRHGCILPAHAHVDSLEKTLVLEKIGGKRRRGQLRRRRLGRITDSMEMNLSKPQETVKDRGASCAAVHGVPKRVRG